MKTISIQIEVPDGVGVRVAGVPHGGTDTEPLPPVGWPAIGMPETAARVTAGVLADVAGCPVHGLPWRLVPAGVSKRTGRPYDAFRACPETGCGEKAR